MALDTQITQLANAVGADVKTVYAAIGNLNNLTTAEKSNLVAALNEIKAIADAGGGGSVAEIDDAAAANSTTKTYSANKISGLIGAAISDLVAGAPTALDTLNELATELADQDSALNNLLTSVGNRVRFDAAQSLTATEKTTALTNIGAVAALDIGDPTRDFVADYNLAKA